MKKSKFLFLLFSVGFFVFASRILAQTETETVGETNSAAISGAQEMLRSNLLLQEQLYTTLRAIEQARKDADASSKKTAELFTEKINAVENNLAIQRKSDLETMVSMRESNRVVLIAAAVLAGIGFFALFLTVYFQVRAMNRMTEMGALISSNVTLDSSRALGHGSSTVPARLNSADQANVRFLAAIEQLEKRIHELDGTNFNLRGTTKIDLVESSSNDESNTSADVGSGTAIDSLLTKGQILLSNGDAEKALACFEEALKLDANNTDALVKKGSALEALRKLPEAIDAYDCAIAADNSLTVAYLYKGGVLNRLQRFAEAMQCYEQALGTPKKAA